MSAPTTPGVAYVFRDFGRDGSLHSFYVDRVRRLSCDLDVLAVCSARGRVATEAPVRFATVEPVARGRSRDVYAAGFYERLLSAHHRPYLMRLERLGAAA